MDMAAQMQARRFGPQHIQHRFCTVVAAVFLAVTQTLWRGMRDQDGTGRTICQGPCCLRLGDREIPDVVTAARDLTAKAEERDALQAHAVAVQHMTVTPARTKGAKLGQSVVVSGHHDHRARDGFQQIKNGCGPLPFDRKITGYHHNIRLPRSPHKRAGRVQIAVQVRGGKDTHRYFANRSKAAPQRVANVATSLGRSMRSRKKNTPISRANTMLVSRKAVTKAIGAWVNAQITSA